MASLNHNLLRSGFRFGLRRGEKERPSPADMRAFFKVMDRWRIHGNDACNLLGGMSNRDYSLLNKGNDQILDKDKIDRIYSILKISDGLEFIYHDTFQADKWMQTEQEFLDGDKPREYLIKGGLQAIQLIHKRVDRELAPLLKDFRIQLEQVPHLKRLQRTNENQSRPKILTR